MNNYPGSGGRETRPLVALDTQDPKQIAGFCIRMGYGRDAIVTTLVERCSLSSSNAERIVDECAEQEESRG